MGEHGGGFIPFSELPPDVVALLNGDEAERREGMTRVSDILRKKRAGVETDTSPGVLPPD